MTIVGSLPSDYESQKTYLQTINQTLKSLETKSSVVSVHSASEPSQATLLSQWSAQFPYSPPQQGSILNWFDPTSQKVQQQYLPQVGSGGGLLPYRLKPMQSAYEFIDEIIIGTPGLTLNKATVPQGYRHLLVRWSGRSNAAGVSTDVVGLRLNGIVTATYDFAVLSMPSTAIPNCSAVASQTYLAVGSVPQAGAVLNSGLNGNGYFIIPNYSSNLTTFAKRYVQIRGHHYYTNTRPWTRLAQVLHGQASVLTAITSLSLVLTAGAANWERGSRMVLYGIK